MSEKKKIYDDIQENRKEYEESEGIVDKYLIAHVKNRLFSCYDGTTISRLTARQKRQLDIETFRFMVEEVFHLTPEQLDSIWSNETLIRMNLSSLARDIENTASAEIKEATLFNKKLIVLHECFPDYYSCTYPDKYDVIDVIQASGATLKNLSKAGKVDVDKIVASLMSEEPEETNSNIRVKGEPANSREIVDRIAYNALNVFLKTALSTSDIGEHLNALAHPNTLKLKSLGVCKVIAARGCWSSLLDFYYLNSSAAVQTMFFENYRNLRSETQKYDAISAFLDEIEI